MITGENPKANLFAIPFAMPSVIPSVALLHRFYAYRRIFGSSIRCTILRLYYTSFVTVSRDFRSTRGGSRRVAIRHTTFGVVLHLAIDSASNRKISAASSDIP